MQVLGWQVRHVEKIPAERIDRVLGTAVVFVLFDGTQSPQRSMAVSRRRANALDQGVRLTRFDELRTLGVWVVRGAA